jgi:hypothetical protein
MVSAAYFSVAGYLLGVVSAIFTVPLSAGLTLTVSGNSEPGQAAATGRADRISACKPMITASRIWSFFIVLTVTSFYAIE